MKSCAISTCSGSVRSRGWCRTHYMLWYRTGSAESVRVRPRGTALERFELWVDKDGPIRKTNLGPCWLWTGKPDQRGYGRFADDTRVYQMAHRWSYEHFVGPVPAGLVLDHLCVNPPCVNPSHLEPVTHAVNIIERGVTNAARLNSIKTHCAHGHRFTPQNTYVVSIRGRGETRVCKECQRRRSQQYRSKVRLRGAA